MKVRDGPLSTDVDECRWQVTTKHVFQASWHHSINQKLRKWSSFLKSPAWMISPIKCLSLESLLKLLWLPYVNIGRLGIHAHVGLWVWVLSMRLFPKVSRLWGWKLLTHLKWLTGPVLFLFSLAIFSAASNSSSFSPLYAPSINQTGQTQTGYKAKVPLVNRLPVTANQRPGYFGSASQ